MMIPPKLQHGDNLQNLFQKFNTVIDYLREIRLVAGHGIRINHLPAGTTIESTATASGGTPSAPPSGHPFDAKLINKGTEENPQYAARIYNSALPDSPYAGFVYAGDWDIQVSAQNVSVSTENGFFVVLAVTYDSTQSPPFSVSLSLVPYGSGGSLYPDEHTFRQIIAEGKIPDIASRITGDITITGRWI